MALGAVAIKRDTKVLSSRRYTCATGTGITKGTFLKLSADQTAVASVGTGDIFLGFAHADVNSSSDTAFNTETSITADKGGVYEVMSSGNIGLGQAVKTATPGNYVMAVTAADMAQIGSYNIIVGYALEAGSPEEVINVEVYV